MRSEKISFGLPISVIKDLILFPYSVMKIITFVTKKRIDIVHVHTPRIPLILGYFVHIVGRIPMIVTFHERYSIGFMINRLYTSATRIIAISPEIKIQLQRFGVNKNKIVIIPNMVDIDVFTPSSFEKLDSINTESKKSFRLLSMGRIDVSKEHLIRNIIKTMPRIIDVFPKSQLFIVGDGTQYSAITEIV